MRSKFASLSSSNLRRTSSFEDEDPTSGLANLSDCMLVLACGLMVALVTVWNIPMNQNEIEMTDEKTEIDANSVDDATGAGSKYIDMGRVYQDSETGKYYMLEESGDK